MAEGPSIVTGHAEHMRRMPPPAAPDDPLTVVICGASGDLTLRKLMPALCALRGRGLLPEQLALVGVARRDWTSASFRARTAEGIKQFGNAAAHAAELDAFLAQVHYYQADLTAAADYQALAQWLEARALPPNRLFYLALKPELFAATTAQLAANGLLHAPGGPPWSRVIIEKPFGHDLESAQLLNRALLAHLAESQIFRIDHYMGKETVQNMLSFRFGNALFEALFNRRYVEHVQITASEQIGIEGERGGYYDATGALRDMLQNHLLQLLCLVAKEPPSSLTPAALHQEKLKVLEALRAPSPSDVPQIAVRGQYGAGQQDGQVTAAYREEPRVAPDSKTETYAALRLHIDNWRWAGVPFFLRAGKRLPRKLTEVAVTFKRPPTQLFRAVACQGDQCDLAPAPANVLVFRIQPDEGVSLSFAAKRPLLPAVESVEMQFSYAATWPTELPEAYERLLLDAIRGDATLFTTSAETEAAWTVMDPILRTWAQRSSIPVHSYEPGTWGPAAANALFGADTGGWRNPSP